MIISRPGLKGFPFLILMMSLLFFLQGCGQKEPVKIGFTAGLSGPSSELGVSGRNAVELACEEINEAGGINGHPVQLVIKDNKGDVRNLSKVYNEFVNDGIVATIGPFTSALVDKEYMNGKLLFLSPTVSTGSMTALDDNFLRVIPTTSAQSKTLAEHALDKSIKSFAVVYNGGNRAYTGEIFRNFAETLNQNGGKVIAVKEFNPATVNFSLIAKEIQGLNPEGVLISATPLDVAMFCQQMKKAGWKGKVLTGAWAMTDDLLYNGGTATEGLILAGYLDKYSKDERFLKFNAKYKRKFNSDPAFSSVFAYESAWVLFNALKASKEINIKNIKTNIINNPQHEGIQNDFKIDHFGDAQRQTYLFEVKNRNFIKLK